jgi:sigma-B regulation protein RsbU (phosphoserine phosphatase)
MTSAPDDSRRLFDEASCGLLWTRADGAIVEANVTVCRFLGRDAHELAGMRFQDLLTIGCKIFHQTHWMPLMQMQGSVAEVHLDILHKDGRALPVLVNAATSASGFYSIALFVAADRRKYEQELLLARRDAEALLERERKVQAALVRTEAELRLALEAAQLRVWSYDVSNGQVCYGPGTGTLIGRPDLTELDPASYAACIEPADRERARTAFTAALDPEQRATYSVEYRLNGADHVQRVVSSTGRACFDEAGSLVAVSGVLQDVTERRRAEQLLEERVTLAEQLVGIVSHDLRSPLNAISLGASLLSATDLASAQARVVARIQSAASRANRLTADLLDFTQARLGGGLRVQQREVDVHELVRDCVEELRLARAGCELRHEHEGRVTATCDPDRVAQVITNLVNNALAYGAPGASVTVSSTVRDAELQIRVHNVGTPIPEALLPHLFEPMRRGEHELRSGARSVGLGLYIVREIASAHGGGVRVESAAAVGTTFVVSIPQAREAAQRA